MILASLGTWPMQQWVSLLQFSRATPASVALLGAHFVVYSAIAWIILCGRFFSARMKERELILLETWLGLLVLELVQMAYHRGDFINGETWGIPRYFGVFAPLLWIWIAWLCTRLPVFFSWTFSLFTPMSRHAAARNSLGCRIAGWCVAGTLIAPLLLWVFYFCEIKELRGAYGGAVRQDVASAAEQAKRIIRRDYAGPKHVAEVKRTASEYFNDTRPIVFSDFGYAAWLLRTQSEGAVTGSGACPYPDDYLLLRMGSGYGGRKTVDAKAYDYVTDIKTHLRMNGKPASCTWRLFRRKGVPHRADEPAQAPGVLSPIGQGLLR